MNSPLSELSQPKTELNSTLQNLLEAMKELMFAHTVSLFWVKDESKQLILEAKVTNAQSFTSQLRFPLSSDVVSQIALNGKPQVVTNINPSAMRDLFCYYEGKESVKSFIGVPIYFSQNSSPVAVLCVDSLNADSFGKETILTLQRYAEIIYALVKNYSGKYDLLLDSNGICAIRTLQEAIHSGKNRSEIFEILLHEISKLCSWNFLSVVSQNKTSNRWEVQNVLKNIPQSYVEKGNFIDESKNIVAHSLQTRKTILIENLNEQQAYRFYKEETMPKKGSFLTIPLLFQQRCFGAVTIEKEAHDGFSQREIELLQLLIHIVASSFALWEAESIIRDYVTIDTHTYAIRETHFFERLENELLRASDYNETSALAIISMNKAQKYKEHFGEIGFDELRKNISEVLISNIRTFDVLGVSAENKEQFFVYLPHFTQTETHLWGEKIRKAIASSLLSLEGKTFSVTASIGLYSIQKPMSASFAFSYAKTALAKATEQGENSIKIL